MIRSALTKRQLEAIKTPRSAKTLVEGLNRENGTLRAEVDGLRANYLDLQNKYESMQRKYQKLDKKSSVQDVLARASTLPEIMKLVLSSAGTGYGIAVVTVGRSWGWLIVIGSNTLYVAILLWQKKLK